MAMVDMLGELEQDPSKGLLGYQRFGAIGGVIVQYWRSFEALESYAKNPDAKHAPVWRAWNRLGEDETASAGIWHETYQVRAGSYEAIYQNMPATGLQNAGTAVTVDEARRFGAPADRRRRLDTARVRRPPARAWQASRSGGEEAGMFDLTGHRALVTGAGDGMGVGIARALARQGAGVAVNDIVAAKADATRDAILAEGGIAVSAPFDITDEEAVNAGIAAAARGARRPHRHPGEQRRHPR